VSTPVPDPAVPADAPPARFRIGADRAAVIVAAVLVLLAVLRLLPSIPFLVR
jgi:exopolyphosphatase/pppGpp-phosphohydrolase